MKNLTESVLNERTGLKMVNYLGVNSNQKLVWFIILKRPLRHRFQQIACLYIKFGR